MADRLLVWLYGLPTAVLTRQRGQLRLAYTAEALGSHDLGTPLLSLSLPLRPERYTHLEAKAFIDGLLPEGRSREVIARDFGIRDWDSFGLIEALGRDCAGAIVIQPEEEPPSPRPSTVSAKPLSEEDLENLVANLRSAPLGAGGQVRISLAGVQEKLLLALMPDGRWGQPINGTPSTHILKPEISQYPFTVENEAFCMRVARNLGLDAASVETIAVGSRKVIVVQRYDRFTHANGDVDRLHQEDFCQATSVLPTSKYEGDGGPSLRRIAGILEAFAAPESTEELLRAVTLNVLLANGDAHAKNLSILYEPSGRIRLAPLYDLMNTLYYYGGNDTLAMYIDNVRRLENVTTTRLVNEAASWGMNRRRASEIVLDVLDRMPAAIESAQSETPDLPDEIPEIVRAQTKRLQSGGVI